MQSVVDNTSFPLKSVFSYLTFLMVRWSRILDSCLTGWASSISSFFFNRHDRGKPSLSPLHLSFSNDILILLLEDAHFLIGDTSISTSHNQVPMGFVTAIEMRVFRAILRCLFTITQFSVFVTLTHISSQFLNNTSVFITQFLLHKSSTTLTYTLHY